MIIDRDIASYIISFMIRDEAAASYIEYGDFKRDGAVIHIVPDSHFWDNYGTMESMPTFPLKEWEGVNVLFGKAEEKLMNGILYIYADIVASAFFLITRYEEMVISDSRDVYGRYIGRSSVLMKSGNMNKPLVDIYGLIMRKKLQEMGIVFPEIEKGIKTVYLTHDVDMLWNRTGFVNSIKKTIKKVLFEKKIDFSPILNSMGIYIWNDLDIFDELNEIDERVKERCRSNFEKIVFLLGTERPDENTEAYILDKKFDRYKEKLVRMGYKIGIHPSYRAGDALSLVSEEIDRLSERTDTTIVYDRHHYLRCISFDELNILEQNGIEKDFTMGYADVIGFRLGTSRCVRWIDPRNMSLHNIELQPLNIMDGTLYEKQYMNLSYEEAYSACESIIEAVREVNGDLCILIHNNIETGVCLWIKKLYLDMADMICEGYYR